MEKAICLVGTLDTKGEEFAYLRQCVESMGHTALLVDCGVFPPTGVVPDVDADTVAAAIGQSCQALLDRNDPGASVADMSRAAAVTVRRLYEEGRIAGVISMGGGQGTCIAAAVMAALPIGFPKVILSTIARVANEPFLGISDTLVMDPIVDVAGDNILLKQVLYNAAAAVCGMAEHPFSPPENARPCVAVSIFGITTRCADRVCQRLREAGYDPLVFHATGAGGIAMEQLIRSGAVCGVVDMTLTEFSQSFTGGACGIVPDRLTAAAEMGIPQVLAPGAVDASNFKADAIPAPLRDRLFYLHNPMMALMRTTAEESSTIGTAMAERINASTGPASVLLPLHGLSAYDQEGGVFYDPAADEALFSAIEQNLRPGIGLRRLDLHINDAAFADALADELLGMLPTRQ